MGGSRNEAEPVLGARGAAASTQHPAPKGAAPALGAPPPAPPRVTVGTSGQIPAWVLVPWEGLWVAGGFNPAGAKKIVPRGWPGVTSPTQPPGALRGEATARASKFVTPAHPPPPRISTPNPALSFSRAASAPPGGVWCRGGCTQGARCQQGPVAFLEHPLRNEGGGHRDTGRVPGLEVCPEHPMRGGQQTDRRTQTDTDRRTQTSRAVAAAPFPQKPR